MLFQQAVLSWFDQHGRKTLPWQLNKSHYRVWVSEIMLQQTQVTTVIPYFQKFIERFPTVQALATATADEVLSHWSGLGYYARARNLHQAAQRVVTQYHGKFPTELLEALQLPGLGRSTASAILALVDEQPLPILDGNVKRVLTRFAAIEGWSGHPKVVKQLWQLAEQYMPATRIADYTQAMMDMGAMVCTRTKPKCLVCPLRDHCKAYQQGEVERYPTAKPVKTKPERSCYFICLMDENKRLFLTRQPSPGIWGGLWAFPMVESSDALAQWLKQHLSGVKKRLTRLSEQQHIFTHFKLRYIPVVVRLAHLPTALPVGQWYNQETLQQVGLPAPIKQMVLELDLVC